MPAFLSFVDQFGVLFISEGPSFSKVFFPPLNCFGLIFSKNVGDRNI